MLSLHHFTICSNVMNFFRSLPSFSSQKAPPHEISLEFTSSTLPHDLYDNNIPTPRVPATGIPIEVVLSILEAAYFDEKNDPDVDLLRNCALVCRAWSIHAQKLLFRQVRLCSESAFVSFSEAVDRSSQRGRSLGDAVTQMRVVLDHTQPGHLKQSSFATAVACSPNLFALDISHYGCLVPGKDDQSTVRERMQRLIPSFDDHSLTLLKASSRITALHLSNWSESDQSVIQLLNVFPSLKSLSITGTPLILSPGMTYEPFSCALQELRINCQREPSKEFLSWLLHHSVEKQSLRILDLERQPSLELLGYLVDKHGEVLHSLAIPSLEMHDHAHVVLRCRSLRELRTESPCFSPGVYRQIPESIQHIAFGLDMETALNPIVDLVKTRDELQAITVNIWQDGDHHPQLPPLKMACAYHGVDLRLTRDVRTMRMIVRGDPVVPKTYPRVQTLDTMQSTIRSALVA